MTLPQDITKLQTEMRAAVHEHWKAFLIEGILLAVLGLAAMIAPLIASLAFTIFLYRVASQATLLPMVMAPSIGLLVLALTVSMCCISGVLALRKVQTADPAEIF